MEPPARVKTCYLNPRVCSSLRQIPPLVQGLLTQASTGVSQCLPWNITHKHTHTHKVVKNKAHFWQAMSINWISGFKHSGSVHGLLWVYRKKTFLDVTNSDKLDHAYFSAARDYTNTHSCIPWSQTCRYRCTVLCGGLDRHPGSGRERPHMGCTWPEQTPLPDLATHIQRHVRSLIFIKGHYQDVHRIIVNKRDRCQADNKRKNSSRQEVLWGQVIGLDIWKATDGAPKTIVYQIWMDRWIDG